MSWLETLLSGAVGVAFLWWLIQKGIEYALKRRDDQATMKRRIGEDVAKEKLLPDLEEIEVTLRKFTSRWPSFGELDDEMRGFIDEKRLRLLRHVELIPDEDFRSRLIRLFRTFNDARLIELHGGEIHEFHVCMTLTWDARDVINAYLRGDRLPEMSDKAFEVLAMSDEAREALDLPR